MVKRLGGLIGMVIVLAIVIFAGIYSVLLTVHQASVVWDLLIQAVNGVVDVFMEPSRLIPSRGELIALVEPAADVILVLVGLYVGLMLLDDL